MTAPTTNRTSQVTDRQDIARRLLASSAKKSYDPAVEVDWDAPVPAHLHGMTPEWSTLYGTPLWDAMSTDQQLTLTRHEVCSIMGTGIWFEMILQQLVLRDIYSRDPAEPHVQFALTEIADECRHSVMFARTAQRYGVPSYRPGPGLLRLGNIFKSTAKGAPAYAGILFAEEILDVMQRDWMRDERVQPVTRTTSKIHVVEEARHMRFAREETVRRAAGRGRVERAYHEQVLAACAYMIITNMVHPQVYAAAGLDVTEALAAARSNTHYHDKLRAGAAKLMAFLADAELVGPSSMRLYRRAHLV